MNSSWNSQPTWNSPSSPGNIDRPASQEESDEATWLVASSEDEEVASEAPLPPNHSIYYIQVDIPHKHDFDIYGPFHAREAMIPYIRMKLRESPSGLDTFDEMNSNRGIASFDRLAAPLKDGNTMDIFITTEVNPDVGTALPGPCWLVLCQVSDGWEVPTNFLRSLELYKTFTFLEDANQAVRELAAGKGNPSELTYRDEHTDQLSGTVRCLVIGPQTTWGVQVRYEPGVELFTEVMSSTE